MTLPFARAGRAVPAGPGVTLDRASRAGTGGLFVDWADLDHHLLCRPVGAIDAFSVSEFRAAVAAVPSGTSLVFDLSGVSFLDSAGLGALIGAVRRLRQMGGEVTIAAPRPLIARVLHTTGFDRIVSIFASVGAAVGALGEGFLPSTAAAD